MSKGYVLDIKDAAKDNNDYRRVLVTAGKSQLVLMSLKPQEAIGMEVHDGDQIIYIVKGDGLAIVDGAEHEIGKGAIVFVPAGVQHNVVNTADEPMKLFTVYAPPQHSAGAVQATKEKAEELVSEVAE